MEKVKIKKTSLLLLIGTFLIYSTTGVFSKMASLYDFLSLPYFLCLSLVVAALGVYAILWQQILKRVPLSQAFLFKSMAIVFSMFYATCIFHEEITLKNIVGCCFIIGGIVINSQSTKET